MNRQTKRKVGVAVGLGVLAWAALARASGKGRVIIGPVTVTEERIDLDAQTDDMARRFTLALPTAKRMMGADPNTLVSRNPSDSERKFIRELVELGRDLSARTTYVPYPAALEKMLALSARLPGDELQRANAEFYLLLGISPDGENSPTVPLTPASESRARELIARWRPYSQDAVDTLYVLLDDARALGGEA